MFSTRMSRRLAATGGLLLVSVGSVLAFRGAYKPYVPDSPGYRQHGPSDAPAVLAIFSDFECGGCAAGAAASKQIEALFPGLVRVVYKHHPWYFHTHAKTAAVLAECAGRQGKFWDVHDRLFEHQMDWSRAENPETFFSKFASEAKLDPAQLAACRADPATTAAVEADLKEAGEHWVGSTPTFFLNGRRLVGLKQLRSMGVAELERLAKRRAGS
ncbi:MAG: thioredoxin domain-containing protein [Elusimicrobia bacterium]|nr:thioredoxin domain-containing protein [Elusimicrobiota bacterium]